MIRCEAMFELSDACAPIHRGNSLRLFVASKYPATVEAQTQKSARPVVDEDIVKQTWFRGCLNTSDLDEHPPSAELT